MGNILYEFDQDLYERDIFQDGKEEGIAIGLAEGERKKALEAAQNALAMGLTAAQAAQLTGLSLEEITQLK